MVLCLWLAHHHGNPDATIGTERGREGLFYLPPCFVTLEQSPDTKVFWQNKLDMFGELPTFFF